MKKIILEMRQDTWDRMQKKYSDGWESNKFVFTSMNRMDTALQRRAFEFLKKLIAAGLSIDQVMTNDWESSPSIIVYVGNKEFRRFSDFDLQRALKVAEKSPTQYHNTPTDLNEAKLNSLEEGVWDRPKPHCEFDSKFGATSQPSCFGGKPEYEVTVIYNDSEKDTMLVCASCKDYLVKDAQQHGYKVKVKKLQGAMNEAYDVEVAKTIIQQLGGSPGRLKAMIGAKNFGADGNMVGFQFMRSNGLRAIRITLNAMDTYDVKFLGGNDFRVMKEFNGIYAEDLRGIFERETGLRLSLGIEEQNLQGPTADTGLNAPKYAQGTVVRESPLMADFNKLAGNKEDKDNWDDILRQGTVPAHYGYQLKNIYKLHGPPMGWDDMKPIRPSGKISAFINISVVDEIRKYDIPEGKHQYFVKAKSGNFYELEY